MATVDGRYDEGRVLMADRDLVVIGGSLGAVEAATTLLAGLPAVLPAAVLIVVTPARARDFAIFDGAGPLPAAPAADGDLLRPGRVHVAEPDRHLLVGPDNRLRLSIGPQYNRLRPAVDPLLLSAARWAGSRTVGVLLSGVFDDGIAGLAALGMQGGLLAVQDPAEAAYPDLPGTAMRMRPHQVGTAAALAAALPGLLTTAAGTPPEPDPVLITETDMLMRGTTSSNDDGHRGEPVAVGCPDCGGGLHRIDTAGIVRYFCHVGHGFTADGMLAAQGQNAQSGLLTVASTVRDQAEIFRQLAAKAGTFDEAERYAAAASTADRAAETIQGLQRELAAITQSGARSALR